MIVVYDVTNAESFVNVKRWLHEIDQNCDVVNKVLGNIKVIESFKKLSFEFCTLLKIRQSLENCMNPIWTWEQVS